MGEIFFCDTAAVISDGKYYVRSGHLSVVVSGAVSLIEKLMACVDGDTTVFLYCVACIDTEVCKNLVEMNRVNSYLRRFAIGVPGEGDMFADQPLQQGNHPLHHVVEGKNFWYDDLVSRKGKQFLAKYMLINNYNNSNEIWLNFVVPFTMKFISYNMDFLKFSVTDFDAGRV